MRIADSTVYHIYHGSWPSTYNDSAIEIYWPLIERFCLATGHGSVIRTADDNTRSQARQIQPFLYFQLRTLTLAECRSQLNRSSLLSLTLSLSASDFKSELNGSLEIEIHGNSIFQGEISMDGISDESPTEAKKTKSKTPRKPKETLLKQSLSLSLSRSLSPCCNFCFISQLYLSTDNYYLFLQNLLPSSLRKTRTLQDLITYVQYNYVFDLLCASNFVIFFLCVCFL